MMEVTLDACPACTASMRDARLHCTASACVWLKCGKCHTIIDNETGTYNRDGAIWGNEHGYLKAE
jgi:hypothetical protein